MESEAATSRAESHPESFTHFCEAAEAIRATRSRLTKSALVRAYLETLSDDVLPIAARFLSGRLFPAHSQQVTGVGHAALFRAVLGMSRDVDETVLSRACVATGDMGDAAYQVLDAHQPLGSPIDLRSADESFHALSATLGFQDKQSILRTLFGRATRLELKYLVKLLTSDLRIGLKEGAVEEALARAHGVSVAAVQRINMTTGDIGAVALTLRRGQSESLRPRLFTPVRFMLASLAQNPTEVARLMPSPFIVEDKLDGIRAQVHADTERVAVFSRTLDDVSRSFPDLVEAFGAVANRVGSVILDGEIVPTRDDVIQPFALLQQRLGRKDVGHDIVKAIPIAFVCYDILLMGDRELLSASLSERRATLETLPLPASVRVNPLTLHSDVSQIESTFETARDRGNEGLMIKDPRSAYRPGRRGKEWLKLKKPLSTLDVVVVAVEVGQGRRSTVLSDYTFAVRRSADDSTLLTIGKAYSGLTDDEIARLSEWFRAHTIESVGHGRLRVVEPRIVLEIAFDRVMRSGRHNGGFALRFPRIVRLREDKDPAEIDTLETVERLADPVVARLGRRQVARGRAERVEAPKLPFD